ncbi:transcriptional regulator [uncultured Flavobacterium sp.]|uniref:transcriptional regulator n=1 Tax=uncultured Flavobacterium sp. TaxID=165435 RepID=UPI0030EC0936
MRISKISSKATYHKCLKNLHSLGYINYEPSYNPFKGSHVILFNFSEDLKPAPKSERKLKNEPVIEPVSEQALNKSCTSDETSSEQALVPSINYINNTNILNNENVLNLNEQAKNVIAKNEAISKNNHSDKIVIPSEVEGTQKEKKLREKKKGFIQPNLQEVKSYFQENNFPELEAQKFFNYFSSNGWLVGGKTPMVDWQAAAQNWILNSINFNHNTVTNPTNRPKHLNTTTDKDYSEPL